MMCLLICISLMVFNKPNQEIGRPVYNGTQIMGELGSEILTWDARTGNLLGRIKSRLSPIYGNRLDRMSLATLASVGQIQARAPHYEEDDQSLWGRTSLVWPYQCNETTIAQSTLRFSPNGKFFLSAHPDTNQIWLREVSWGNLDFLIEGKDASFDRSTSELLQVEADRLTLWSLPELLQIYTIPISSPTTKIQSTHFNSSGTSIVGACSDHRIRVWSAKTGALTHTQAIQSNVVEAGFADDQTIVFATEDGNIQRWDLIQNRLLPPIAVSARIHRMILSRSGRYCVVTVSASGETPSILGGSLWDLNKGKRVSELGPNEAQGAVGFGTADLDFCSVAGQKVTLYNTMFSGHWSVELKDR